MEYSYQGLLNFKHINIIYTQLSTTQYRTHHHDIVLIGS